jgi:hypothetical protein
MKPIVAATPDQVRENLRALAAKHNFPLAPLSRMVGRPSDYLAKFVRGGGGEQLKPSEQEMLAKFFRVDPRLFGEREH